MEHDSQPEAYYVHVWIRGIHPMLWRRFLIRSDSTLADLHAVLQIGFDWTDFHLHRFRIRKRDYAVPRRGGLGCHDREGWNWTGRDDDCPCVGSADCFGQEFLRYPEQRTDADVRHGRPT